MGETVQCEEKTTKTNVCRGKAQVAKECMFLKGKKGGNRNCLEAHERERLPNRGGHEPAAARIRLALTTQGRKSGRVGHVAGAGNREKG